MRLTGAALAAAVLLTATGATVPARAGAAAPAHERPNIVLIVTDDMTTADLAWMPITTRLVADRGVSFDSSFVNNPACCPSRVTMLTGRYAHNTGIFTNGGVNGGFEAAHRLGLERDTVATRLQRSGYRTGLFGKYLNGYPNGVAPEWVPPGWTRWVSPVSGDPYGEYDYTVNVDGALRSHGRTRDDYGTTVYGRAARAFLRSSARRGRPFFAVLAVYAPHLPAVPAPEDATRFPRARAPRTPSFDQADVSASPGFVRELPRFTPRTVAQIDSLHRDRIRSLQAVDREVGALVRTARAAGVLDTTYLVFTSDNGFHLGQHRLPAGKYSAYDTDIRVPLLVRGPGIPAGGHVHAITGNVDLAPTFEAMAGARRPSSNDGRSLLRLARDPDRADRWPRNAFLVEHRQEVGVPKPARADVLPVEPGDPEVEPIAPVGLPTAPATPTDPVKLTATQVTYRSLDSKVLRRTRGVPNYDAVRTSRWLYVEYANGERELYDVRLDPDQLVNLAGLGHVSVESTLRRRLDALRSCRGRTCRAPTAASAVGAS